MLPIDVQQFAFLPVESVDQRFGKNATKYGYRLREVDIGDITFQSGQKEGVHRWYRLTPSYSPALVRYFLKDFDVRADEVVLDPFSGRGTTVIECQKHGIRSVGFEINPLLQQVGALSLNWRPIDITRHKQKYLKLLQAQVAQYETLSIGDYMTTSGEVLPDIHDVFRWWKPGVLKNLLIAKALMRSPEFVPISHYLWLAINSAALECANIHRNHPTITFHDDHKRNIDVVNTICAELSDIDKDLKALPEMQLRNDKLSTVQLANSCNPITTTEHFNCVITSPPYPNRFSYVHQTRPQLHFMGIIHNRRDATEIDLQTVGGTWGRATSNLMKEFIAPPSHLREALDYIDELQPKNLLMCNYATKYFLDLNSHIVNLRRAVAAGFRGAYVVGNSRLSGVEIFTEVILARLFELNGFSVDEIVVFRKRGGRKRLYETAVCVSI
jgi:hypothetical protein